MSAAVSVNHLTDTELDQLCVNTIRTLSIDAVQQAKSGHPGAPMALAPLIYTIWNRVLRFDPENPIWPLKELQRKFGFEPDHVVAAAKKQLGRE